MGIHVPEDNPTKINPDKQCNDRYHCDIVKRIEMLYIISAVLWLALVFFLELWKKDDIIIWLFIILPLIVFVINYLGLADFTCKMEDQMFKGNFLSFGFLVAIILINWNAPLGHHDKTEFFKILIVAFILLMISLIDLWVGEEKMPIVKHIKTVLHTASLTLLATALYLYYTYYRDQLQIQV